MVTSTASYCRSTSKHVFTVTSFPFTISFFLHSVLRHPFVGGFQESIHIFLAPSGGQGVTMTIHPFVRLVLVCLDLSIFIFYKLRSLLDLSQLSFMVKREPKILRLVGKDYRFIDL